MLTIQNFILIILILGLLNYIKCYNKNINKELYTNLKKPMKTNIFEEKPKVLYGEDQFNVIPMYKSKTEYKYQNIDFLKENNKFELTDKLDFSYDKNELLDNFHNESKKGVVASGLSIYPHVSEPPLDQKTMYDYKFEDVDVKEILSTTNFEDKSINEVYDKLLIDYKKLNQAKTPKTDSDELIKGAFNESSYKGEIQEYEEDNYGNAYDPSQSLLLAL
jgi:hypothetical protein